MNWRKLSNCIASLALASTVLATVAVASTAAALPTPVLGQEPATAPADSATLPAEPAATPQSLKKTMWGPLTHNGQSMFPIYKDLGVGIYATAVHWDQIVPTTRPANPTDPRDPTYIWPAYLDQAVSEARRYGIRVQFMLIGAPAWANGGQSSKWAPHSTTDFADFTTAVARRYPSVHHWMIWGEPNRKPNFAPLTPARRPTGKLSAAEQVAPRTYAQLLDAAYGALKRLSSSNLVIGGNTYTSAGTDDINPYQWIRYLRLPDGSRPRMDMWGHNPYGFRIPNLKDPASRNGSVAFGDLRRLTRALDRAFPQRLPLYLAEWGVPIGYYDEDLTYSLKAKEGVRWIRAGFRIARRWSRVYSLGWVHPVDTSYSSQGLLDTGLRRKPGYNVYKGS